MNYYDFGRKYKEKGLNISCITNVENKYNKNSRSFFKTPSHKWKHLFEDKQTDEEFENYEWYDSVGVGTFTKFDYLCCIDIDGCNDYNFIAKILKKLNLPVNYQWVVKSGSNFGFHIYFKCYRPSFIEEDTVVSSFPPRNEFEGFFEKIEFLWETHCVLPPSIHGSGHRYKFQNVKFPLNPPIYINEDSLIDFINEFLNFEEIEEGNGYGEVFETIISSPDDKEDNSFSELNVLEYLEKDIYCIIDIETDGLPKKSTNGTIYPEIFQIAWTLISEDNTTLKKKSYIVDNPIFRLKNKTGLDKLLLFDADLNIANEISQPIENVLMKLIKDIKISEYIVSHNTEFDLPILENAFNKYLKRTPLKKKTKICTMKKATDFCKIISTNGYKYPKLSELYEKLFKIRIDISQNAEVGVAVVSKCFKKMRNLGII